MKTQPWYLRDSGPIFLYTWLFVFAVMFLFVATVKGQEKPRHPCENPDTYLADRELGRAWNPNCDMRGMTVKIRDCPMFKFYYGLTCEKVTDPLPEVGDAVIEIRTKPQARKRARKVRRG